MQELNTYFKSIIDTDNASVVICDAEHNIVYMNPAAAEHYSKWGGENIIGKSIFNCHNERSRDMIVKVVEWFKQSVSNNKVHTFYSQKEDKDIYMIAIRNESGELIGYYEKHEYRTRDTSPFYDMG